MLPVVAVAGATVLPFHQGFLSSVFEIFFLSFLLYFLSSVILSLAVFFSQALFCIS
jgi:hypothetical protein